jgi:hypothetical protein
VPRGLAIIWRLDSSTRDLTRQKMARKKKSGGCAEDDNFFSLRFRPHFCWAAKDWLLSVLSWRTASEVVLT